MGSDYRYYYGKRHLGPIDERTRNGGPNLDPELYSRPPPPPPPPGSNHGYTDLWNKRDGFDRRTEYDKVRQRKQMDNSHDDEDSKSHVSLDSGGKQKSFKRLVLRFAEKTSMQGIPYINMAKFWWARLIWITMTVVAIGMMIFHLVYLFDQYFSYPRQTTVSLGFDNLRFPSVTICNVNPIRKRDVNDIKSEELRELIEALHPDQLLAPAGPPPKPPPSSTSGGQTTAPPNAGPSTAPPGTTPPAGPQPNIRRKRLVENKDKLNLTKFKPDYDRDRRNREEREPDEFETDVDSSTEINQIFKELYMGVKRAVRRDVGHQIDDMLLSCAFNGRECYADNFTLYQSAEYGNCFTLDSAKMVVKSAGPVGGLSLVLYLETLEFLEGYTNGYGARLVLHQPGTLPFPADEGVFIPASMETSIGLRMIALERIGQPWGNCEPGADFLKEYRHQYSRTGCSAFCHVTAVIQECGCVDIDSEALGLRINKNLTLCGYTNDQEIDCMIRINRDFQLKKRTCPCKNPCSEAQYLRAVSNRQWPTDAYSQVLLEGVCENLPYVCDNLRKVDDKRRFNNNFLKLNIYYEDLNFENITETPEIADAQFLSDVGGAVGLWIGLSILSMFELVQLLAECCAYGHHKCRKSGRTNRRKERQRERRQKEIASGNKFWPETDFGRQGSPASQRSSRPTGLALANRGVKENYSMYSPTEYDRPRS